MNMDIGQAMQALEEGRYVTRKGWNGRGMFLWWKPPATVRSEWCHDPVLKHLCDVRGGTVDATGTVCMYTAQGTVVSGWLASQTDLSADDFEVVDPFPEE